VPGRRALPKGEPEEQVEQNGGEEEVGAHGHGRRNDSDVRMEIRPPKKSRILDGFLECLSGPENAGFWGRFCAPFFGLVLIAL
jgi:hypothetical protein